MVGFLSEGVLHSADQHVQLEKLFIPIVGKNHFAVPELQYGRAADAYRDVSIVESGDFRFDTACVSKFFSTLRTEMARSFKRRHLAHRTTRRRLIKFRIFGFHECEQRAKSGVILAVGA